MRRVVGVDINGWKDVAARDWDPEEPEDRPPDVIVLDGGLGGVAIRQRSGEWTGGPQAALAPHGRGPGWGDLGATDRRISISQTVDELVSGRDQRHAPLYAASAHALSRGAEDVVIGVPDIPAFDEAAQGRILALFRGEPRPHWLLWRPVAVFLHALETGEISKESEGALFRFLIHSGDGIEIQTLRLRRDNDHPGHFAPERDGFGIRILTQLGLQQLQSRAHNAVLLANPQLEESYCERSALALQILCGNVLPGDKEILRLNNSNWLELTAPAIGDADLFPTVNWTHEENGPNGARSISATFLVTPLSDFFGAKLASLLTPHFPNLRRLSWDALARGALRAGRLIERGLPHYFDRLTPISLAVMKSGEPEFEDLVGSNATLPANREYVSPPYRDLKWIHGKRDMDFYVLKGDSELRHWEVHFEQAPTSDIAVELRLKQTPGQSWARLSLTSPEWEPLQRSPILLDWATLSPVTETPSDILDRLRTPPPTIPTRIVEPPHIEFWRGSDRLAGIIPFLRDMNRKGTFSADELAKLLCRSIRDPDTRIRSWPIGTDGALPDELSESERQALFSALRKCGAAVLAAAHVPLRTNGALRSLTWAFTLCPDTTKDAIVEALEKDLAGRPSPLLAPNQARTVLTQGSGRAVTGSDRLRRVLNVLASRPPNADTLNAFAMILSRRAEAPQALTPELVQKIMTIVSEDLIALTDKWSFKIRFRNALSALAGLFRYREVNEYALIAGRDPMAKTLSLTVDRIDALLLRHRAKVPRYEDRRAMLASIRDYLIGAGDPNILLRIESLDDDEDNQGELGL